MIEYKPYNPCIHDPLMKLFERGMVRAWREGDPLGVIVLGFVWSQFLVAKMKGGYL